ncbi:hypothetical protein R5R35_002754 [Gryllus longicercus]|uniref:Alcohol dehydrogenase n=1 Tax=Gryllus longicercus TaxID=2509291 RepID=A0AAN9W6Q1_9ORTH
MNLNGRIAVCGTISTNNADPKNLPKATVIQRPIIANHLKIEGFTVAQWRNRWMDGTKQNLQWVREGKLKYTETVTDGFDNMPSAFIGLLKGQNTGKAIVKV